MRPGERFAQVAPRLGDAPVIAHAFGLTFVLTALLATTYLAFHAAVRQSVERATSARHGRMRAGSERATE